MVRSHAQTCHLRSECSFRLRFVFKLPNDDWILYSTVYGWGRGPLIICTVIFEVQGVRRAQLIARIYTVYFILGSWTPLIISDVVLAVVNVRRKEEILLEYKFITSLLLGNRVINFPYTTANMGRNFFQFIRNWQLSSNQRQVAILQQNHWYTTWSPIPFATSCKAPNVNSRNSTLSLKFEKQGFWDIVLGFTWESSIIVFELMICVLLIEKITALDLLHSKHF